MHREIKDDEDDPIILWGEIHRLRAEAEGPDGFETWADAATDERWRRVQAERKCKELEEQIANLLNKSID